MLIFKQTINFCFIIIATIAFAQDSNVFLDRSYWKTNPSIEEIEQNISKGHDISALNKHAFDAVSWALIEKTDNKTVKYLLTKEGNGVNKLTHDGRTYIFWAAYRGNLEMMQYLVDKGAKTDIIDSHGYSLLNFGAITGQLDKALYDFCIKHGSNIIKEKNNDGANALLLVSPHLKDVKFIDYFVSKGLNINSLDNNGNGIFYYAAKKGNIELLKQLIALGVDYKSLNKNNGNAIISASIGARKHVNTITVFKYLESIGIKPNVVTTEGETPLHYLAYSNKDLDLFNYFLSKGVAINQENKEGKSALTNAIYRNDISVIQFLIDSGANVKIKDNAGNNLMYYALKRYSKKKPETFEKILHILEENKLDIREDQAKGNTLLHIAVKNNNLDLVKQIYKLGIAINKKNNEGIAALQIAAMKSKDDTILKYLLSIGADKTVKTGFNETVYDLAKENELLQAFNINFLK